MKQDRHIRLAGWLPALLATAACARVRSSPYESSTIDERAHFKRVVMPLPSGARFKISQGAFGCCTHNDPGHEYTWDFDVPYGTPVLAVEGGVVIQVWQPSRGGGCDPRFNEDAHNVKVRHADGTVAQYVHIQTDLKPDDRVSKGQQIAVTAMNGNICTPQLDFGIFIDAEHLFGSGRQRNIPLLFDGLPDGGMAHEGFEGVVP
jgi:murein DD-endopeptidase MepM/ murein hydrolase activator NlpD